MFKKAQGMSINTIIIAIIVLVVLIILVLILSGYFKGWTSSVATCEAQGGKCIPGTPVVTVCASADGRMTAKPLSGHCDKSPAGGTQICCPPGTTTSKYVG